MNYGSALWSNSHSSHSMAIETPLDPVEGEILKTDSNRPSVPPGHPMVDQQGQFKKGSPNRDHRCGVLPVHRQQYSGLGAHLQELTASGIWSQDQSQLHINVLERQASSECVSGPSVNLFALGINTKLATYISLIREETSWKVDSLVQNWDGVRGFSEAVAQRLAISQRQPSAGVYESKWKVFGEWCHVKQINPVKATVQQLADFLIFLFEEKKLAISSMQGYRSCISKVFLARGIDISHDRDLNMLVRILPSSALCNTG